MSVPAGVLTALITPCAEDGTIDEGAVGALIDFQVSVGVSGLFVLGTAGAGPLLDAGERTRLTRTIVRAAGARLGVVVHVGALPTSAAERLASEAVEAGAQAIAAVPPVYYQPDFVSVRSYYEKIAAAAPGTPLLAYNNPSATGYDLRPEQAAELHRDGIIAGVKQATTSVADLHALLAAGIPTWMANSGLNTAALTMGAQGVISTITNVVPELFIALYQAVSRGDLVMARQQQAYIDSAAARLRRPTIGALHAACSLRGLPGLSPREPLRLPDQRELDQIRDALKNVH